MLEHSTSIRRAPSRVVVIGAGGFVGRAICTRLAADKVPVLALTRNELDLLKPEAAAALQRLLREDDSVVFVSALAPTRNNAMLIDNLRMAETLGINTSRLFATAFALGSGLAALGGGLGAELLAIAPGYALDNLVYFLIVVAVGGLGSIRGPFLAALVVGISDTGLKYFAPELGAFFIYALTMAILLRYPRSIFGQT